jgi:hypothetical protein
MNVDDPIFTDNGEQPRFCHCAELLTETRKRFPCPMYHDCDYVRKRNRLIEQASKIASERVRLSPEDDSKDARTKWTRQFSIAMDELSAPLLRNGTG